MAGGRTKRTAIADGWGRAVYEAVQRQRHGDGNAWSLGDFAAKMGVSQNTVTRWLKMPKPPSEPVLRAAASILGVGPDALRFGVGEEIYLINLPRWMAEAVRQAAAPSAPDVTPPFGHVQQERRVQAEEQKAATRGGRRRKAEG